MPETLLVLGGGLSGLLAAWHLRRAGREVEVWEASANVGGWAQTLAWPGPQGEPGFLERGPQGLRVGRGDALDRLLRDLDLQPLPSGPKGPRWLGKGGRRHPSPASPGGLLRAPGLTLRDRLRMLAEPFIPAGGSPDESLHAFLARRLGEGFARELLPALVAGVFAAPPERIGLEALPRLRRMDAPGGLFFGAMRAGHEHTRLLEGGTGALARALTEVLGCVRTSHQARALEPLPEGRWRIHGDGSSREADAVVLALPARAATELLRPLAPTAAGLLGAIPHLDLRVWHSRHRPVPGWGRDFNLLIHPPEGRGLLGVVGLAADDPRTVPGLLQLRVYLGGAYAMDADLETWPGVLRELKHWLPELGEALQVREEACPAAFPLVEPGHRERVGQVLAALPPNLHWVGAARFGPGLQSIAEGIETWIEALPSDERKNVNRGER